MCEELDNVVRIFNNLEKKVERMAESQKILSKKVDGSIKESQRFLDKVTVKSHKKKKSHK